MSFSILTFEAGNEAETVQNTGSGLNVINDDANMLRSPSERMGHVCVTVANRYLVMWGGHRVRKKDNRGI